MKKLLILLFFLPSLLLPSDFSKIYSVNFDLVGVVASGNKIAAYGTKGSVYYSDDDAQNWDVIKPFETGNIVNFFIEDDRLIAFLQTGEVSQSYDNGLNWNETNLINDSVSYVIKGNGNYYVRAKNSIIKLSDNLNLNGSYDYPYNYGFDIKYHYLPENRRFMTFLDNKLFVIDTSLGGFMAFDENLNKIETIDINDKLLKNNYYITNVISDSDGLIFKGGLDSTYLFKMSPDFTWIKVLLNNNDKDYNRKLFNENSPYVFNYNLYNNKLYTFNKFRDKDFYGPFYNIFELYSDDSANYKGIIDASIGNGSDASKFGIVDFVVENDRFTGVSTNNFIVTKKLSDDSTTRISDLAEASNGSNLFKINESDFLLIAPKNLYRSTDTTKTFNRIIGDSALFSSYVKLKHRFNKFDNEKKKLLYFAYTLESVDSALVFVSDDYGESFKEKKLEGLNLRNLANNYTFIKMKNNYVIAEFQNSTFKTNYYDENFILIKSIVENEYRYWDLFGDNLNEFTSLVSTLEIGNNRLFLKRTTDGGDTWSNLRTFDFIIDTVWNSDSTQYYTTIKNNLRYYKNFDYNGNPYLLFVTYNSIDSLYKIEVLDLQTSEFSLIYSYKQNTYTNTLVELIDGEYFICKGDSLFTTEDIFNYNKWKGQKLPNNGTMLSRIMKSGDYLITYYYDDIHPYNIYRIKWNELTTTGITENDIETYSYFYNSPPFPQPTSSLVTTKVYLDQAIALSKSSIKIFNVNGTQVEKGDNVEISGSNWPTTLTWDSSNQPSGVYFIVLNYSGNTNAIKVIKQ